MQQAQQQFTFMKKFETKSAAETKLLASKFAAKHSGSIIALTGELGSGKTTFVQGFAKGLGIKEKITSPTFVIIRQYPNNFYHVDLYRIDNFQELGLEEILANPNNIVLIEWAEKIKDLPKNTIKIIIEKLGGDKRLIAIA